jgi:hypothetical protein
VDRADGLESELEKILQSDDQIKKLAGEMGITAATDAAGGAAPDGTSPDKNPEGGAA